MIIAPRNWFGQPMHRHAPPKAIAVPGRRSSRPLSPPCPFVQFGASCNAQACGCIHPGHGEIVMPSARIPGPSGKMPAISASQRVRQRLPTGCGSCATIAAWQRWPIIPTIRRKARLPPLATPALPSSSATRCAAATADPWTIVVLHPPCEPAVGSTEQWKMTKTSLIWC